MATQAALDKYRQLVEEISTNYQYGKPFVQCIFLALTLHSGFPVQRNNYVTDMGRHFGIPTDKLKRVIALLPA